MSITLPLKEELCPFNMAPLTSPAIQLIFGDTLAVELMKRRELSLEQYAKNHPGGRIGKRLQLRIKDIMHTTHLPLCEENVRLLDVLSIMTQGRSGCVLVTESHPNKEGQLKLAGIFTDGDLRRLLTVRGGGQCGNILEQQVNVVMNKSPMITSPDCSAWETFLACRERCSVIPVVDQDVLVGIVSNHDFVLNGLL
jgi:arabinose-5-phosphate isomerase